MQIMEKIHKNIIILMENMYVQIMENIEKNIDLEESRRILMDSDEEVNYKFFSFLLKLI